MDPNEPMFRIPKMEHLDGGPSGAAIVVAVTLAVIVSVLIQFIL